MKKLSMVLLIPAMVALASPWPDAGAVDARWKTIARPGSDERILYDPGSVLPSGPGRFRVQVMGFDADHAPRKSEEEYDCANRIVRDLEVVSEPPGRPATRTFAPSEWRGVVRESPRWELLQVLCR